MAKKKEPVVQAEIVEAFARMLADAAPEETPETAGGYLTLTETHIIFLEALEISQAEKAKEVRTTFETLNNLLQSLKERAGAEKEKVYGSKELDKLTITDEEETKRLYALAERVNELIDEGKEQYIKLYAADKERIKADAARAILAETFEDFSIFRAYEIIAYTNKKKAKNEAAKTEQKKAAARIYDAFKMFDYYIQEHIAGTFFKVWEINNQGKDALKEWEENTQGAKDRLYKEWLEKVPKAELESIGLLKKDEKELVTRKPELQTHPVKLKVPTSLLFQKLKDINSEFLKKDNGTGQTFMLVTDYFYPLEVATKGKKKNGVPIVSYAAVRSVTGEELPERLRKIGEFDIDVLSAVGTLNLLGNMRITPEQIDATMTGAEASTKQNKANNKRLPESLKQKILLSLEKWRARILYLNFSGEIESNLITTEGKTREDKKIIDNKHFELTMLSYDLGTYKTKQGTEGTEIIVHTLPVVYRYSGWKNQITDIENRILAAPYKKDEKTNKGGISATEDNIALINYLARRIDVMKTKQKKEEATERGKARRENRNPETNKDLLKASDRSILFDTIFKECDIVINNGEMKRKRIVTIENILTSWKREGSITDYKIISEGTSHNYTKVLIALKEVFKA